MLCKFTFTMKIIKYFENIALSSHMGGGATREFTIGSASHVRRGSQRAILLKCLRARLVVVFKYYYSVFSVVKIHV